MATYTDPTTGKEISQPYREGSEYAAFAVRIIRSMARRASGDPELLPALREIQDLTESCMVQAIASLRREGYSWADIAERMGTTRQAAQQRYGKKVSTDD